jgi:hypothetical protein
MMNPIIITSVLSVMAMMLISCASEPATTTTTTRQTTVSTQAPTGSMQPIGYRDNNMETGGPGLGGR